MTASENAATKSSCLTSELKLKKSHQYFFQAQAAMFLCEVQWGDFCVWAPGFMVVDRVLRDDDHLSVVLPK